MKYKRGAKHAARQWLVDHPGMEVTASTIASETGFTTHSVTGSLAALAHEEPNRIVRIRQGWYVYKPGNGDPAPVAEPTAPEMMLFEQVGTTKSGLAVLRRQDGVLGTWEEMA